MSLSVSLGGKPSLRERASAEIELRRRKRQRYFADPVAFIRECIAWREGEAPAPYQLDIANLLADNDRVAVRGPRSLGKSALAAWLILWFALTRDGRGDWKVITTASVWRQLTDYLWPEVWKWAGRLRWDVIGHAPFAEGREMMLQSLRLSTGAAFAVASNNAATVEGAHADNLLYIFDEAKIIPADMWDSVEGAFASGGKWLALSTPGSMASRFYDICSHKPGYDNWRVRVVTHDEAMAAGRVDKDWSERMAVTWRNQPALYKTHVLGEFAEDRAGSLIPLSWVEAAQGRYTSEGIVTAIGVDVGGGMPGSDESIIAVASGANIIELRGVGVGNDPHTATMQLVGEIVGLSNRHNRPLIMVDSVGIGLGVLHRLRELGHNAQGFVASAATALMERSGELGFANWRSAGWWLLMEMLEPGSGFRISLPPDEMLTGDLTAPQQRALSTGRIQVESKDDIRKRLGRSPDRADAVIHALAGPVLLRAAQSQGTGRLIYEPEQQGRYR